MKGIRAGIASLVALHLLSAWPAEAASLRVTPVTLDLRMPRAVASLKLRNDGDRPLDVQVRVFRWTQSGGADLYEATSAVIASPPVTRLAPHVDYTVRIARISKAPIVAEESYRVVVDEIPANVNRRAGTVNLVVRHSIPVFFRNPEAGRPKVSWKLARDRGSMTLVAPNTGGSRLKLANLSLQEGNARIYARSGLVGYVLAGATLELPVILKSRPTSPLITLTAKSQDGSVHETVPVIGR